MKISLRRIIMYILILSIGAMGWSFSRYTAVIENTGAENEDVPVIEFSTWALDYEGTFEINSAMLPGDWYNTLIKIRNYESDGETITVSDYDQKVNLELVTTGNLPLAYTLGENEYGAVITSFGSNTYRIGPLLFTGKEVDEKTLNLTATWHSADKDEKYKYEIDYVVLKITAIQDSP